MAARCMRVSAVWAMIPAQPDPVAASKNVILSARYTKQEIVLLNELRIW
jgi:hypothetical protein